MKRKQVKIIKSHKPLVIRLINAGDVICSMVTTLNNTALYIKKLLRQQMLKVLTTRNKIAKM